MSDRLFSADELATIDDIASRLRMNVTAASNIVRGRDHRYKQKFPQPLLGNRARGVWLWEEVEAWCTEAAPTAAKARKRAETFKQPNWTGGRKAS